MSSNAADAFRAGLKGRHKEDRYSEHVLLEATHHMSVLEDGKVVEKPPLKGINGLPNDFEYVRP